MCTRITSFRIMSDESKLVHVKCVVLRARNLVAKGKGGNNDVFVTIQLGKEKYQTSTIKSARHPEWFEECDLPIPHLHSEIEVTVYHHGVLSDDFLGYTTIPLWEQRLRPQPQTQWIKLRNKPGREPDNKGRGEIEVKVTFHCHSRVDHVTSSSGLKKRSSSLRNLASVVGDKLKFTRSRSFRENRKDPEGSKTADRNHNHASLPDIPEEGLTRSYSMSGAYCDSMALDRGHTLTYTGSGNTGDTGELRTQSLLDIAGNRHSMVELLSSQPPPPYHPRPSSQDDITLLTHHPHPRRCHSSLSSFNPHFPDFTLRRERAGRYESIRERTEPESSSTSSEELFPPARRRRPLSFRGLRGPRSRPASEEVALDAGATVPPDPSQSAPPSQGGSRVSVDGGEDSRLAESQRSELITNGSLHVERGRVFSGPRHKSASSGELTTLNGEVRLRKRSKRERFRMYRGQGGGRLAVEGVGVRGGGLYDDSMSEPCSDTPRTDMVEDLFTVYKNLGKEELLRVVIQNKAQLIRKDQYIRDLEAYIDNLLVRVMETQPRILHRPPLYNNPPPR